MSDTPDGVVVEEEEEEESTEFDLLHGHLYVLEDELNKRLDEILDWVQACNERLRLLLREEYPPSSKAYQTQRQKKGTKQSKVVETK